MGTFQVVGKHMLLASQSTFFAVKETNLCCILDHDCPNLVRSQLRPDRGLLELGFEVKAAVSLTLKDRGVTLQHTGAACGLLSRKASEL